MTGLSALFQALRHGQQPADPRMVNAPQDWYALQQLFAPDRMQQGPMPYRDPMQGGPSPPADSRMLSALFEGKR